MSALTDADRLRLRLAQAFIAIAMAAWLLTAAYYLLEVVA